MIVGFFTPHDLDLALGEALGSLSSLEMRQLLQFASGSDCVPVWSREGCIRFLSTNRLRLSSGSSWDIRVSTWWTGFPFDDAHSTPDALRGKLVQSMELGGGRLGLR